MTSQPQVPGAPAVYLYREETTQDSLHLFRIYARIKVLTESGKQFGTVELPYATNGDGGGKTVEDISGRTIHSDGRIIPFTGQVMKKMVEKSGGTKFMTKVFSLPEVEVGSILEYRYNLRMDDHWFSAPEWFVQSNLYTRKAYYKWLPTNHDLLDSDDGGKLVSSIAWWPVLPKEAEIKQTRLPPLGTSQGQLVFELDMHDVPPAPDEEQMPPIRSFSYRVLFYYTPYRTPEEYWKNKGKSWSKRVDKFTGPGSGVTAAVQHLVLPGDSQEVKLKKIYAAVMQLDNTDLSREHSKAEEKADGLQQVKDTDDILARKRGSGDQLTRLFVAMARAAGMKAYVGVVTNRDTTLFAVQYMSMRQLDDDLAIVTVDGKEAFFDPGTRFCPYGQLAWKHSLTSGIRQTGSGTAVFTSPGESYKDARTDRLADLKMDEQGNVKGTVTLRYTGPSALHWRQEAVTGDTVSLNRNLTSYAERILPNGMDVKVSSIQNLTEYEAPFSVTYDVSGPIGSSTGKRLLIPGDLFEVNTKTRFPHEKRETPVYFEYPSMTLDAVRVAYPASIGIESAPKQDTLAFQNHASYSRKTEQALNSITTRRSFAVGEVMFLAPEYPELRTFYSSIENKDQESIVLIHQPTKQAQNSGTSTGVSSKQ